MADESNFSHLLENGNHGWPRDADVDDGAYLSTVYGAEGWCHQCGIVTGPWRSPLVLADLPKRLPEVFVPHGESQPVLRGKVADEVRTRFPSVMLRPVVAHGSPGELGWMIEPLVAAEDWWDHAAMVAGYRELGGEAGTTCTSCGRWKWYPSNPPGVKGFPDVPMVQPIDAAPLDLTESAVMASREWFGDGWNAFRWTIFRSDFADLLTRSAPRSFLRRPVQFV